MKIRYAFVTGEVTEVEVSEELGRAIAEMTHRAALKERAETRRHVSLDRLTEAGVLLPDSADVEALAVLALDKTALIRALERLQPQQRYLVQMVFFERSSIADIAREEGVLPATVSHRLERIYQKLKKLLE